MAGAGAGYASIARLLPVECRVHETTGDLNSAVLYPEEEQLIARAVASRRAEFATVRLLARRALADLGLPPGPLLPGIRGAPRWPAGIVGSMTHCSGYRAAVVARSQDVLAVGIDAEPHLPLPFGVLDQVAGRGEQAHLDRLAAHDPTMHWDRLLFCVKEAVYKVWSPLTGRWLGFEQTDAHLTPARAPVGSDNWGTFTARLLVPGPRLGNRRLQLVRGGWSREDNRLHAALWVPGPTTSGSEFAGTTR